MQTMIRTVLTLTVFLALTLAGRAEIVKVKGKGEVAYTGIFSPGSAEERAAIVEAKKNALSRFAAGFDSARFELYKRVEPQVVAHLDDYVTDFTPLDQQTDKTSKRFSITIEASVNATLLENAIQKSAGAAPAAGAPTYMTFVFVAREQASRKAFDPFNDSRELIMDILKHGAEVEVKAPEFLREAVIQQIAAMQKKYKK